MSVQRQREQSQRIADLERLYAEACRELDEERDKVSRMMQPMPTDAVPGESSQVWRMLQQWTANRDAEKRQERERQRRDEARIAELEVKLLKAQRRIETWGPVVAYAVASKGDGSQRLQEAIKALPSDERPKD